MCSRKSSCDKGTLFQLRNVLSRSSIGSDASKNMKSHEDFFLLILYAHIIVAASNCTKHAPSQTASSTEISKQIVLQWVKFPLPPAELFTSSSHHEEIPMLETSHDQDRLSFSPPEAPPSDIETSSDNKDEMEGDAEMEVDIETSSGQENGTVNNYAVDILTLRLLWHGFKDATKKGDGDRIILCYKLLLPIYRFIYRLPIYRFIYRLPIYRFITNI